MFQFRHLPFQYPMNSDMDNMTLLMLGFPIRKSSVQSLLATPRGLSQPTTSFIGNLRQGIRYMRLCSFLRFSIYAQGVNQATINNINSPIHFQLVIDTYRLTLIDCYSIVNNY